MEVVIDSRQGIDVLYAHCLFDASPLPLPLSLCWLGRTLEEANPELDHECAALTFEQVLARRV